MSTRTRTITLTLSDRDYYALRMAATLFEPLTRSGRQAQERALAALEDAWTGALLKSDADIICTTRGCWLAGLTTGHEAHDPGGDR